MKKQQPTYQTCHVSLAHFCKGHCLMQTFLLFFKGPAISDTLQIWVHVHPCTPLTDQKKSNTPVDSQHSCTPLTDQKKSNTPVDSQHSLVQHKKTHPKAYYCVWFWLHCCNVLEGFDICTSTLRQSLSYYYASTHSKGLTGLLKIDFVWQVP